MDIFSVCAIVGMMIGILAFVLSIMFWAFNKLDGIANKLDNDIKNLSNKIDDESANFSQRTDQLYMIIIDLLKKNDPKTNP